MHTVLLLAATALGLDYGWQPLEGGGFEYIIQIEPELLDALQAGEALRSDLPQNLRDVRSYRIQVGRGPVPRLGNPQAAAVTAQPPAQVDPVREEPSIRAPRDRWTPYGEPATTEPPKQPLPAEPRYPAYNFRTETPAPKLPAQEPSTPRPVDDDTPRPFKPDPSTTAMVKQTTAYGTSDAKSEPGAEAGPSAKKHDHDHEEAAAKPWLPLTFTLLCLFVSLGGNAYLGLQWWSVRQRCQELLRQRRAGNGPHTQQRYASRLSEPRDPDTTPGEGDDEDQDVRAISDDELPRNKRRRGA